MHWYLGNLFFFFFVVEGYGLFFNNVIRKENT